MVEHCIDKESWLDARERLAQWMIQHSYATGHGDTVENLLGELTPQHAKRLSSTPESGWNYDMTKAPRDNTLLQLLIQHDEDEGSGCDGGFENETITRVMGFNNGADDGEDVWKFPGWDWCQDCIIEQGCGTPIAWALMLPAPPAQEG